MHEYDEEAELQIRTCVEGQISLLASEQSQYLLDQLDLARLAALESGRLGDRIEARVAQAESDWAEIAQGTAKTREQIARARELHAELRAGQVEDSNIIGGLHTRLRAMEGEMQAEIEMLRNVAVAAAQYRAAEETPIEGEGMIQLMGARQVLDDALREWVEFKGYGPEDFDPNG